MEGQRTSALQQRLQQRREMFLNKDNSPAPSTGSTGSSGSASSSTSAPIYSRQAPNSAPPQPPSSAPPSAPRSAVKDTLSALNNKENAYGSANGVRPSVAPKPRDISPQPEAVIKKSPPRQLDGYVGFANLPNQVYRKSVKKGFEFTLMVVGETGLGKSTLMNSMFLTDIYSSSYPGPSQRLKKTVSVETNKVLLKEGGVNLTLTVVDTPGFGDAVDNSDCWNPVLNYVESQYEAFLEAETKTQRNPNMPDSRVHACLYFIAPSGHGLKPLDIEFMKQLHDKVNIIPVLAKADTMTPEEITAFKQTIMNQIAGAKIKIYEFPDVSDGEENDKKENRRMKERVPFAVVGSNMIIDVDGKKARGRKYPWGAVNIENLEHCDFVPLRNMLIRTHLMDLKDVTNFIHYENYRCRKLAGITGTEKVPNKNPLIMIEEEQKEHVNKLNKMEREMEEVFERKVREKKQKLSDNEMDLEKRQNESKTRLEQLKAEMEEKKAAFEQERLAWEAQNNITIEMLKQQSMESLDGKTKSFKKGLSGVSFRMGK